MKNKHPSAFPSLVGLYAAAVAIRFALALLTRQNPSIGIDEYLYTGLARSIGTGNGLMFLGQTADYSYIAYPLFLSPVYALFPSGTNFFRILQLLSIMLMQSSVFPIYGIAAALTGERGKKLLFAAAVSLLLPEFIFGSILFSECLIYPLFFTAAYLALRESESSRLQSAVGIGVCAGLLYEAKPGQIVFPVVFLALSVLRAIRQKDKRALFHALSGLLVGAGVILAFRLLCGNGRLFGVYENQLAPEIGHLDRFLRGAFLYPVCFVLACGAGMLLIPLRAYQSYSPPARRVLVSSLVSLLTLAIGTAWVVNRAEYASSAMHLRYVAMFIPLVFMYAYAAPTGAETRRRGSGGRARALLCAFILWIGVSLFVPFFSDFRDRSDLYYAALSMRFLLVSPGHSAWKLVSAIEVIASVCALFFGKWKNANRLFIGVFIGVMALNNALGYADIFQGLGNSREIRASGDTVLDAIGDEEYLYVSTDPQYGSYGTLAVNTRQNAGWVLWNDLFNSLVNSDGVYRPYVPSIPLRGTVVTQSLPDTELLVMDDAVFNLLKPSANANVTSSALLYAVRIRPGERWLDSMIGNLQNYTLAKDTPGILIIFDEEAQKRPMRLRMKILCDRDALLTVRTGFEERTVSLVPGTQWAEIGFDVPASALNFFCTDADIDVYAYELSY